MDNRILAKYICSEASLEEQQEVERWLNDSPHNRMELERLEKSIRFVVPRYQENSLNTDKAWKEMNPGKVKSLSIPFRRYLLQAASVIIILAAIGSMFLIFNQPEKDKWISITTRADERKEVYLPDSTLITLAGNSSLRYEANNYLLVKRNVQMKGKAFFSVKRNEARPFTVQMPVASIEVLGTSFQAEASDSSAGINVTTGKVRFSGEDTLQNVILTAGMSATYTTDTKKITLITEEDLNYLSWKTGLLRFNQTPLPEVITELNAYYNVSIPVPADVDKLKLTASFNNLPLEQVLLVINQTLDTSLSLKK